MSYFEEAIHFIVYLLMFANIRYLIISYNFKIIDIFMVISHLKISGILVAICNFIE